MPIVADLEASFGAGGFDLSVSVTGMGDAVDTDLPDAGAFNPTELGQLAETLRDLDLSDVESAVGSVAAALGTVVDLLPGADVLEPLETALAAVSVVGDPGLADLRASIDSITTDGSGLDSVVTAMSATSSLLDAPVLDRLSDLLDGLAPGFDLGAVTDTVTGDTTGVAAAIRLVGGLMGIASVVRTVSEGVETIAGFVDLTRVEADLARLDAWAGNDTLVDLVTGIDPDDPILVDLVAGPILDYTTTIGRLGESVVTGLAWGEATLAGLDIGFLLDQLQRAVDVLDESSLGPVRELTAEIRARLDAVFRIDLPAPRPVTEVVDDIGTQVGTIATAIDSLDPAQLASPVRSIVDGVVDPLRDIEAVAAEVHAAASASLAAARTAVTAIDVTPITDALGEVIGPIATALDSLGDLVADAQAAVEDLADEIGAALGPISDALETAAAAIRAAFGAVADLVDGLGLEAIGPTIAQGADAVADALRAAQLGPIFDTVADALDATATALSVTPRDLLPDDVKQALEDACGQLQAVDLEATRVELHDELHAIRDGLDATVLDELRTAQAAIVEFLATIDPRPPLQEFEDGAFDDLVSALRSVDPTEALAPVIEAVGDVQEAIAGFDPLAVLEPVDDAIDTVTERLDAFDPVALMAPVDDGLAAVRALVEETLGLDEWDQRLDELSSFLTGWLADVELRPFVDALDTAHDAIVHEIVNPPVGPGPWGTLVASLLDGADIGIRADALVEVTAWMRGDVSAADAIADQLGAALDRLDDLVTTVEAIDLSGRAGPIITHHDRLVAAVSVHAGTSVLRLTVDSRLEAVSPAAIFGPVLVNRDRYLDGLRDAAGRVRSAVGQARDDVDSLAVALHDAASPLFEITAQLRVMLHAVTGVTVDGRSFREILADILGRVSPSELLGPIADALERLRDRTVDAIDDALVDPLRDGITSIRAVIDTLDLSFIAEELGAARDDIVDTIDSLRPSTVLGPVDVELTELRDRLVDFDVLGPVRAVVETLSGSIGTFDREFRPTVLAADALDAYDRVEAIVAGLAVADLLAPVFSALDGIEDQLGDGMDQVIDSLVRTQQACASGGPSIGGALGAAADLVGSAVGGDLDVSVGGSLGF